MLKLRKAKASKKVGWTGDTVDNEHLNRKKSKCETFYDFPSLSFISLHKLEERSIMARGNYVHYSCSLVTANRKLENLLFFKEDCELKGSPME